MTPRTKKTTVRPFTAEEINELRALTLRCFIGRPRLGDFQRAQQLFAISPEEYKAIGEEVREEERNRLRSM